MPSRPWQASRAARGVGRTSCMVTKPTITGAVARDATTAGSTKHRPPRRREQPEAGQVSVIERTFAWLSRFRRLAIRYERRLDLHHAFTAIACSLICLNALQGRFWKAHLVHVPGKMHQPG
jgi:hypothetical protein